MVESRSPVQAGVSVFRWAMVILAVMAWFLWTAGAVETDWIEGLSENGTGGVVAAALVTVPLLVALLVAMLRRYRETRRAALVGWLASLPLFAGLFFLGYHLFYTTAECVNC